MISLYSGTPGSGKSLHVACKIYYALWRNRPVIANFEIKESFVKNYDCFNYVDNNDLSVEYLVSFSREYFKGKKVIEGQILLVVDECQLLFDCRDWNKKGRDQWISFFTQHRKLGYNIVLVAQFDKMLDKQLRALIEYEFIHRKVSNFGWKGKLFSIWTGNRLFVAVQIWYPLKQKVGSEFYLYKKKFGDMYETFNIFSDVDKKMGVKQNIIEPSLPDPET